MTPTDIAATKILIQSLWPRSKWSPQEWEVFIEKSSRLPIEGMQADAALRELKATSDKYPTVSGLLGAMKATCTEAPRGLSPVAEVPYPNTGAYRRQLKCHGVILPDTATKAEIVVAWWKQTIEFRMRAWGDIPESRHAEFADDCRTMADMTGQEISEWWDWLMAFAMTVPLCPRRSKIRERVMGKVRQAVREAVQPEARPA